MTRLLDIQLLVDNLVAIRSSDLLSERTRATTEPLEAVCHCRLTTTETIPRKVEPPPHLDSPEATIQQAKYAQKKACDTQSFSNILVVDIDSCQVEDEERGQTEEKERRYVNIHVSEAKPIHVPAENTAAAE